MQVYNPKTPEEYMDLLDQAIFEIEDVLACAADEGGDDMELSEFIPIYEYLAKELKALHEELVSDSHKFGLGYDLSFNELLVKWGSRIPCNDVLFILNDVYKKGFRN